MKEDSNHALVATWALIFCYLFISVDADILCSNKVSLQNARFLIDEILQSVPDLHFLKIRLDIF